MFNCRQKDELNHYYREFEVFQLYENDLHRNKWACSSQTLLHAAACYGAAGMMTLLCNSFNSTGFPLSAVQVCAERLYPRSQRSNKHGDGITWENANIMTDVILCTRSVHTCMKGPPEFTLTHHTPDFCILIQVYVIIHNFKN